MRQLPYLLIPRSLNMSSCSPLILDMLQKVEVSYIRIGSGTPSSILLVLWGIFLLILEALIDVVE